MGHVTLLLLVVAPMILLSHAGTVQKAYTLKLLSKDGKDYIERINVDIKKNTQTSQLQEASSGKDFGDTIYDFQRNLVMTREPEKKVCFLSHSTGNHSIPRVTDLIQLYNMLSKANVKITPETVENFKVADKLQDRSGLSKEMADLCANLPIYRVVRGNVAQSDVAEQMSDEEAAGVPEIRGVGSGKKRRGLCRKVCDHICWYNCGWSGCSKSCKDIICNAAC